MESNKVASSAALAVLKSQPGIDIRKQAPNSTILLETDAGVLELRVVRPADGLIEVSSADRRLRQPVVGRLLHSVYALDDTVMLDRWIGKTMKMVIAFSNATFVSGVVLSATVRGQGWHYDVF